MIAGRLVHEKLMIHTYAYLLPLTASIDRLYAFSYRPSSDAIPSSSKVKTSSTSAQPSTAPTPSNISNPLLELPHDENSPLESTAPFLPIQPTTSNSATSTSQGWNIYSPREEFARMGVGTRTKAWRFTDLNKDYVVSSKAGRKFDEGDVAWGEAALNRYC